MPHSDTPPPDRLPAIKTVHTGRRGRLAGLLTFVILLLPVIALKVYIVKYPLRWTNKDGVAFLWARNFKRENQIHYKTVILGDSSTNAAFASELLGEDVINLAVRSMAPSDIYWFFKECLSRNGIGIETVYIDFYATHFFFTSGSVGWITSQLDFHDIDDEFEYLISLRKLEDKDWFSVCNRWLQARFGIKPYLPYLKNIGSQRREQNKKDLQRQWFHRGSEVTRTVEEWNPDNDTRNYYFYSSKGHNWLHFAPSHVQDFYYRQLLELCTERNIRIRIQALPITFEHYGPAYWDEFRAYHDEILAGYDNWTLDTAAELSGGFSIGDFADDHHFNNHGSLKFSRMIRERHPEDFAEGAVIPVSDNTLAGLEDYICMENRADMILQWIQGTGQSEGGVPLSALFITRNSHVLEEDWQLAAVLRKDYSMYEEGLVGIADGTACFFSGDSHSARLTQGDGSSLTFADGAISLSAFDDGRKMQCRLSYLKDDQPYSELFYFPTDGVDLFVLVFNNRIGNLVTSKSFRFTGWSYRLQKVESAVSDKVN